MSRITEAARGSPCRVRIPGYCNADPKTTVFAHYRGPGSGAGGNKKPIDLIGSDACSTCHDVLDRRTPSEYTREDLDKFHQDGMTRTLVKNHAAGLIICL